MIQFSILQDSAKKSMEKKYNQVLQKQGIDTEEIENIWKKLLPKTGQNRKNIGLLSEDYDSEVYQVEFDAEYSEEDENSSVDD